MSMERCLKKEIADILATSFELFLADVFYVKHSGSSYCILACKAYQKGRGHTLKAKFAKMRLTSQTVLASVIRVDLGLIVWDLL